MAIEFDPPIERVDQAAFAAKSLADRLSATLDTTGWSCLRLVVEAETEHGERLVRLWRHDGALTAGAMAERVRWQLEGWLSASRAGQPTGGLVRLALVPDLLIPATGRQLGFWGGHDEAATRVSRAAVRLASMLGPEAVRVADPHGGRSPTEQFRTFPATAVELVERAEPPAGPGPAPPPWPGRLPVPSPPTVFQDGDRRPVELLDGEGRLVTVGGRGLLSAPPTRVRTGGGGPDRAVTSWAGPWPLEERWWDAATARRQARCQVVTEDGEAWLIVCEGGSWFIAAAYD